jgi:exosortase
LEQVAPSTEPAGLRWLVAGLLAGSAGAFLWIPWLVALGFVLAVRGLLVRSVGREQVTQLTSAWLLLWLVLPPPYGADARFRQVLQLLSSRAASEVLDLCRFNHLLQGNTLRVPGQQFFVEEACSGVHSLFALFALTAIYVVWTRRSLLHVIVLLAAAVFWATLLNVARISCVVICKLLFEVDISTGWPHELLGVVLFCGALAMLFSTEQFLQFLLAGDSPAVQPAKRQTGKSESTVPSSQDFAGFRAKSWSFVAVVALFGALGLTQLLPFLLRRDDAAPPDEEGKRLAALLQPGDLPAAINGWNRMNFEKFERTLSNAYAFGDYSSVWSFSNGSLRTACSFDYPFSGWHNLWACYEGQGWRVSNMKSFILDDAWSTCAVEFDMERSSNEYGHVTFVVFDRSSRSVPPFFAVFPLSNASWDILRGLVNRRLIRFGVLDYVTYQFQTFTQSATPITDEQRKQSRELFIDLLPVVRARALGTATSTE